MKNLKKTNFLLLAAIMCVAIACSKESKESGKVEISKKETQASTAKDKTNKEKTDLSKKTEKVVEAKAIYQKKDTYFVLPNRNGGKIDLAAYEGKSVALIFFANYCPYCKKAAPFMKKLYDTYTDKGLIVLGISVDTNKETADTFAGEQNLDFPIAYDGAKISMQYKARGVPYIFVLNASHEVMDFWAGYDESYDVTMIETVAEALAKQTLKMK